MRTMYLSQRHLCRRKVRWARLRLLGRCNGTVLSCTMWYRFLAELFVDLGNHLVDEFDLCIGRDLMGFRADAGHGWPALPAVDEDLPPRPGSCGKRRGCSSVSLANSQKEAQINMGFWECGKSQIA